MVNMKNKSKGEREPSQWWVLLVGIGLMLVSMILFLIYISVRYIGGQQNG